MASIGTSPKSVDDVGDRADELLTRGDKQRAELGSEAASFVAAHHTQESRLREAINTMMTVRASLLAGRPWVHQTWVTCFQRSTVGMSFRM